MQLSKCPLDVRYQTEKREERGRLRALVVSDGRPTVYTHEGARVPALPLTSHETLRKLLDLSRHS